MCRETAYEPCWDLLQLEGVPDNYLHQLEEVQLHLLMGKAEDLLH